tara:strand:- start:131 stop:547 length:417 start_codon:yes stop_codon:yes gene_type:complete
MTSKSKKTLYDFIPNYPLHGDKNSYIATAGKTNSIKVEKIDRNHIINVLEAIEDPEIPVNIYDLGLIYDIEIEENNNINIKMSLTAPGCPVAGEMPQEVADKVSKIDKAGLVQVELIWDPPWSIERMSDEARLALDIG